MDEYMRIALNRHPPESDAEYPRMTDGHADLNTMLVERVLAAIRLPMLRMYPKHGERIMRLVQAALDREFGL